MEFWITGACWTIIDFLALLWIFLPTLLLYFCHHDNSWQIPHILFLVIIFKISWNPIFPLYLFVIHFDTCRFPCLILNLVICKVLNPMSVPKAFDWTNEWRQIETLIVPWPQILILNIVSIIVIFLRN